jgi:hypothetical protein
MIRTKILWLLAFLPLLTYSQQADAVLSKFFATPLDETVFLRWTITAGNTCEDTHIERSSDGISYERIGLIGGICGSPDQSITYEFTDTLPLFNHTSYYRLKLGYYGFSSPQTVKINRFNESGYQLAPNPFSDFTRLAFENDEEEEHKLIISDMNGRIVQEMMTTGDEFIIRRLDMNSGLYFFRVFSQDQVLYSGKLVVK